MAALKTDTSSLFKQRGTRAITYQEAHDELMSAYDNSIGIDTGSHHVGMSGFEDPVANSLYSIWYDTYLREQVWDYYHCTIDEWLDQPRWKIQLQLNAIRRRRQAENAPAAKAAKEMENLEALMKKSG